MKQARFTIIQSIVFLLILTSFKPLVVKAETVGRFTGMQYMINIVTDSRNGQVDDLPGIMYKTMNVPPQNSFLGLGKALATQKGELSFICSLKQNSKYHCSIMVFSTKNTKIDRQSAFIEYKGEQARALYEQFTPYDDSGIIHFVDEDKLFQVISKPDLFQLSYNYNGF